MERSLVCSTVGILGVAACLLLTAQPSLAGAPPDMGKGTYAKYCAACHGANGKGDGPAAAVMSPKPADLTQISKKNGGVFPYMDTMNTIRGVNGIPAHGNQSMPIWGDIFDPQGTSSIADHANARGQLILVIDYLQSIQAK